MRRRHEPPPHYNPHPHFGLRVKLSRTAMTIVELLKLSGEHGIERERIVPMLYMTDLVARRYLGRPITDHTWRRRDLVQR